MPLLVILRSGITFLQRMIEDFIGLETQHYFANSFTTRAMCFACFKYRSNLIFSLGAWASVPG